MPRTPAPAGASTLHLPPGSWKTVLDCLCDQFPAIDRAQWEARFAAGRVLDEAGRALPIAQPFLAGMCVRYFREVAAEPQIPFEEQILHVDEHLVVVDKPHFVPVMPSGGFVEQTLARRVMRKLGNPDLVPLHRIDRVTAGLVLFSARPDSRGAYQALFRERRIAKRYLAVAPPIDPVPPERRSRIVTGDPFFRMREEPGEPNASTRIELVWKNGDRAGYALSPVTGRKHQLRVQMAALGAPIFGDSLYPDLRDVADDDYSYPLQLLAESLAFDDPLEGKPRAFRSALRLRDWPVAPR
jgi:tRNA pseudouridine32 synthase/23S rRNA pseudouridine746 synthase